MFTQGIWKCEAKNEIISIKSAYVNDEYWLEYKIGEDDIQEKVGIYIVNKNLAHMTYNKRFGTTNINILNNCSFRINNEIYRRV